MKIKDTQKFVMEIFGAPRIEDSYGFQAQEKQNRRYFVTWQ